MATNNNEENKGGNGGMDGITIEEQFSEGEETVTAMEKENFFRTLGVERTTLKQPQQPQPPQGKDLEQEFLDAGGIEVEEGGPIDENDL